MLSVVVLMAGCEPDPGRPAPEEEGPPWTWVLPLFDRDHDGWRDDEDCAADNPAVHPGAPELCNGRDDDCDGEVETDGDGDGVLGCADCADADSRIWPGAPDAEGDHLDQDCDGTDGVGEPLSGPALTGGAEADWLGYALAAGDLDADGCDDLLIGQPGQPFYTRTADSAVLTRGCWPWSEVTVRPGQLNYRGEFVDVAGSSMLVHEPGYRLGRGHALLFDAAAFHEGGEPLFEVTGDDVRSVSSAVLLGEGPEWLLYGRKGYDGPNRAHYGLISLPREGIFDLEQGPADEVITTDSHFYVDGALVGDVGDRDGDGQVDLGFGQQWLDDHSVYFFPAVTSAHLLDAPEIWRKGGGTIYNTQWIVGGGEDLDGDGADDAVVADANDDVGEVPHAGRVYLLPWLGPGERLLAEAPARIDGELEWDWTGLDSAAGDLDGDGQVDLVVGAPSCWSCSPYASRGGKVMIFSGPLQGVLDRDDAVLVRVGQGYEDRAGVAIALGDFDGSGILDVAVGAPGTEVDELRLAGAVYLMIDPL
jgi:hypothetical protein